MNDISFDHLARTLSGPSRRALLGGALASVLGLPCVADSDAKGQEKEKVREAMLRWLLHQQARPVHSAQSAVIDPVWDWGRDLSTSLRGDSACSHDLHRQQGDLLQGKLLRGSRGSLLRGRLLRGSDLHDPEP